MSTPSIKKNKLFHSVKTDWIHFVTYGLILLIASFIQGAPYALEIAGAKPLLLVDLTVCIALFYGPLGGGIAGAFAGILWDIFSVRTLGFNAIVLLLIGTVCGLLIWLMLRNNIITAILLISGACLLQAVLDWFFHYLLFNKGDSFQALIQFYLPNVLYSAIVGPIIFFLVFWLTKKIREHEA